MLKKLQKRVWNVGGDSAQDSTSRYSAMLGEHSKEFIKSQKPTPKRRVQRNIKSKEQQDAIRKAGL